MQRPLDLETVGEILHRQAWTFAKSYPWVPHYWVTAKEWNGEPCILDACHYISTEGTRMLWGKSNPAVRRYVDWKGWRYWHMDFDAFFERFDSDMPPTKEQMEAWDCKCYLINRQQLSLSKAKKLTADMQLPSRCIDFTRPMRRGPKAQPKAKTEQKELTLS